jgi:glycosyltransferase involved in cell wall biosynthesis
MSRICIVTPGHLSTNPRVVKEADALSAAGHQVEVITGRFSAWSIEADRAFDNRAWTRPAAASFGPIAPLGLRLRQKAVRSAARALTGGGAGPNWAVAAALHEASPDLAAAALRRPADLYIGHYDAALIAVSRAARRHGAAYAFDAEDFHPGDLADGPGARATNDRIRRLEGDILPGCAYVSAASPGIAEAYAAEYGLARPTVVLNVFSRSEAAPAPTAKGAMAPGPSLYWFSQTLGPDRGLEWVLAAVAAADSRPHLYLRGKPAVGYEAELRAMAQGLGVADRLHLLDAIAPAELIGDMSRFDLGYVGETGATPNHRIAMANKLFSYLLAGLPTLASDIPAHRALESDFREAMTIFPLADPRALAARIDALLLDPDRLAAGRAAAWRLGQTRFNWETEQARLIEAVDGALAGRRRR